MAKEGSRRYPAQTFTDAEYADDIAFRANTPARAKTLLHSLKQPPQALASMSMQSKRNTFVLIKEATKGWGFESSGLVHLLRKQYLINRERHQYAISKGMDSYRLAIGHLEVRPDQ